MPHKLTPIPEEEEERKKKGLFESWAELDFTQPYAQSVIQGEINEWNKQKELISAMDIFHRQKTLIYILCMNESSVRSEPAAYTCVYKICDHIVRIQETAMRGIQDYTKDHGTVKKMGKGFLEAQEEIYGVYNETFSILKDRLLMKKNVSDDGAYVLGVAMRIVGVEMLGIELNGITDPKANDLKNDVEIAVMRNSMSLQSLLPLISSNEDKMGYMIAMSEAPYMIINSNHPPNVSFFTWAEMDVFAKKVLSVRTSMLDNERFRPAAELVFALCDALPGRSRGWKNLRDLRDIYNPSFWMSNLKFKR